MIAIDINYFAVLMAGIAYMLICAIWYSPMVFGNRWMKAMNYTKKDIEDEKKNGMGKTYGLMFMGAVVMSFILTTFVTYAGATTWLDGMLVGFLAWLGFVATTMLTGVLFEKRSLKVFYLSCGYHLVSLLIMGGIIALWA